MLEYKTKIVDLLLDNLNLAQLDPVERQQNSVSGEDNPFYNIDAIYMIGGLVNQCIYSMDNKKEYLDKVHAIWLDEKERNPENPDVLKQTKYEQVQASMDNVTEFYNIFVDLFNCFTGITWNNGKRTADHGAKWYAEHIDKTKGFSGSTTKKKLVTAADLKSRR